MLHSNLKFFKQSILEVLDVLTSNDLLLEYDPTFNKYQLIFHNIKNKRKQYFTLIEFEVCLEEKIIIPINKINFIKEISLQDNTYIVLSIENNKYQISSQVI